MGARGAKFGSDGEMNEDELGITHYLKGNFAFFLPDCWTDVGEEEEESFVEKFDCEGVGRLLVECRPVLTEEDGEDPAAVLRSRERGPNEAAGPIVHLASGLAMQSYSHGDADVAAFRWSHCELVGCFEPGLFGSMRFSICSTPERLRDSFVAAQVHFVRVCARRSELVDDDALED
ncbi:MAG: hypothetical protein WA771_09750 [Chthoniobacterales bacterium]